MEFVARFRFYSPYNAMLIHCQMPGALFVAPPHRWLGEYRRRIKTGSRPLIILQPMGPVMFVFDVSQTEPEQDAPELPIEATRPFEMNSGSVHVGEELERTIENAKRDGVGVTVHDAGSQYAGMICLTTVAKKFRIVAKTRPTLEYVLVPQRYDLLISANLSRDAQYATLVHELAHLYCGHLGSPNEKWWPSRVHQTNAEREFEAESVCYLVCQRLGIDNPSDAYLGSYYRANNKIPSISLECVLKAAGLIEQMGHAKLAPRKEKEA
jgi:hypothetical protein